MDIGLAIGVAHRQRHHGSHRTQMSEDKLRPSTFHNRIIPRAHEAMHEACASRSRVTFGYGAPSAATLYDTAPYKSHATRHDTTRHDMTQHDTT